MGEFGEVCGEFLIREDAEAGATFGHGGEEVITLGEHLSHNVGGFFQCVGVDVL